METNKNIALRALLGTFVERDPSIVGEYFSADHIQHNPTLANGSAAIPELIARLALDPQSNSYEPEIPPNPSTNILNLRAGMTWDDLDVSVFVNNTFNSHPALNRYQDTPFTTLFTNLTLRPRTVGITGSYRF